MIGKTVKFLFPTSRNATRGAMLEIVLSFVCFLGLIFWADQTELKVFSKSIGQLVPDGELASIQHIKGGVAEKLLVVEGQIVEEGDVLLELNKDELNAEIGILSSRRDDLFEQARTVSEDYNRIKTLHDRGLVTTSQLTEIERARSQSNSLLKENAAQIEEAQKRLISRTLRAPTTGYIQDLQISRSGELVSPYEPVMFIVPVNAELLVQSEILAAELGTLTKGDDAEVKITAFDYTQYGKIDAEVTNISAFTRINDAGDIVYDLELHLDPQSLQDFRKEVELKPGLITDVDLITGNKTLLEMLLAPVLKSFSSVFQEG